MPYFEPSKEKKNSPVGIVNVDVEDRCQSPFYDGDEVICRINRIDFAGDDVFTFKVSVLKVF